MASGNNSEHANDLWVGKPHALELPTEKTHVDDASARLYEHVAGASVDVLIGDGKRGGSGSGVIIDKQGHVATDAHVALAMPNLSIVAGGNLYDATVEKVDGLHDLAILNVPGLKNRTDVHPIEISHQPLKPGEAVYSFGHPSGVPELVMGYGQFAGSAKPSDFLPADVRAYAIQRDQGSTDFIDRTMIKSDAFVLPGSSGGALVNAEGKLVGLVDSLAIREGEPAWGLSTPAQYVDQLKNAPSNYELNYQRKADGLDGFGSVPFGKEFTLGAAAVANLGLGTKLVGGAAVLYGATEAYFDAKNLLHASDWHAAARWGAALAADVGLTAGAVMSFIPSTKLLGRGIFAASTALKIGADYIPYHPWLNSVDSTDKKDQLRACMAEGNMACENGMKPGFMPPKDLMDFFQPLPDDFEKFTPDHADDLQQQVPAPDEQSFPEYETRRPN